MPEAEVHNEVLKSVYVEMIYNVRKFCKNGCFNLEQSGAILSQFHLTHLYMKSDSQIPAEKVYLYFKELMLCHSLPVIIPQAFKVNLFNKLFSFLPNILKFSQSKNRNKSWNCLVKYIYDIYR